METAEGHARPGVETLWTAKRALRSRPAELRRAASDRLGRKVVCRPIGTSAGREPSSLRFPASAAVRTVSRSDRAGQYMSWLPPCPAGVFSSLGFSATKASLVSRRVATLAAFCNAVRVTFVGSITPALTRSSNWPVAAL